MERQHYIIAAVIAFSVAAFALSGLFLSQYLIARLAVGALWAASAVAWVSCYAHTRKMEHLEPVRVPVRRRR